MHKGEVVINDKGEKYTVIRDIFPDKVLLIKSDKYDLILNGSPQSRFAVDQAFAFYDHCYKYKTLEELRNNKINNLLDGSTN